MYLTGEQPAYADQLINHLQSLPNQLLEGLEPAGPTLEIADRQDVCAELAGNQLYVIESGLLQAWVDERPVFFLCEGDLLGLRQELDLPACRYSCEDPVRLRPYSRNALFAHIHAAPRRQELFTQYLIGQIACASPTCVPAPASSTTRPARSLSIRGTRRTTYSSSSRVMPKPSSTATALATCRRTRSSAPWRCSPASNAAPR